jgi:thiol-disulfide isomerase/thioredoxin
MSPSLRRILVAATLLFAICCFAGLDDDREEAPRFSAKSLDGEKFSNDSVKGKVLLLQFWTTWCPYCRGEESLVNDITTEFKDKGLIVLAIDVGESKKKVKEYLADHPRTPHIVLTSDTNLAAMYAANSYPIYVVIDREGFVAGTQRGAAGERRLRNLLRRGGMASDENDEKSARAQGTPN